MYEKGGGTYYERIANLQIYTPPPKIHECRVPEKWFKLVQMKFPFNKWSL